MELYVIFILIFNEFDMISVIIMNFKGINEDLLIVESCCYVEVVIVGF